MRYRIRSIFIVFLLTAGLCYTAWEADNGYAAASGLVTTAAEAGEKDASDLPGGSALERSLPRNAAIENSISGNAAIENSISGNAATENSISGNVAIENSISGNAATENSISGNAAIENSAPQEEEENAAEEEYAKLAIANVDHYVNVRSEPNTDSEIAGKIYDGAVAEIQEAVGENGEWFRIISGNVEGYIKAEFFIYGDAAAAVIDDYVTRYAQVQADRLNVRIKPHLSAQRIGYIDFGEKVKLLENCGEWLCVQYTAGQEGYVASEYVMITEEFRYAKSPEEERAEQEAQRALAEREAVSEQDAPETVQITAPATEFTSNEELRAAVVEYAMQYIGDAYVHGGSSLSTGTDCSGFTCFIYADFGYSISRTPSGQLSSAGRSIDYSEIQPGDIICYTSNGKTCTHVGLYIGDGQIVHAANARKGVITSNADYSAIMGVKNVID